MHAWELVLSLGLVAYLPGIVLGFTWGGYTGQFALIVTSALGLLLTLIGGIGSLSKNADAYRIVAFVGLFVMLGLIIIPTLIMWNHGIHTHDHRLAFSILESAAAVTHIVGIWGSTLLGGDTGLKITATLATALYAISMTLIMWGYDILILLAPVAYVIGCGVWGSSLHLHKARYE
jgi:hypothetical protein